MKHYLSLFCVVVAIGAATAAVNTTQCLKCLDNSFEDCSAMAVQNCSNPETESCFSAAGRYNFNKSSTAVLSGVARGCITCENNTARCTNLTTWVNQEANWTFLDCNIQCCKGDKCNTVTVDLPPTTGPTVMSSTSTVYASTKTSNARPIHHFQSAVLFITAIVGVFFF